MKIKRTTLLKDIKEIGIKFKEHIYDCSSVSEHQCINCLFDTSFNLPDIAFVVTCGGFKDDIDWKGVKEFLSNCDLDEITIEHLEPYLKEYKLSDYTNAMINQTAKRDVLKLIICNYSNLEKNWDSYDAEEITETSIVTASNILDSLLGKTNMFTIVINPMRDGGVQIEINDTTKIEILNDTVTTIAYNNRADIINKVSEIYKPLNIYHTQMPEKVIDVLKVNKNNKVSITRIKDFWNKEELIALCRISFEDSCKYSSFEDFLTHHNLD